MKRELITGLSFALLLVLCGAPKPAHGAYLYFEPGTISAQKGDTFEVLLKANSEGENVFTIDTQIEYDPSVLGKVRVSAPADKDAYFPSLIQKTYSTYFYMGTYTQPGGSARSADAPIAKVQLSVLKETPTQLKIRCTPGKANDSNFSTKKNGKIVDIIECTKNKGLLINSGGVPTSTPTPTQAPTSTPTPTSAPTPTVTTQVTPTTPAPTQASVPTPTPSVLPETGIIETAGIVVTIGVILTVASLLIKLYVS